MLFLLLGCDPDFETIVTVHVPEDTVALYDEEEPGIVTLSIGEMGPLSMGLVCGEALDLSYRKDGIGCGSSGETVTVELYALDAFATVDTFLELGCGAWAVDEVGILSPDGDPDFTSTAQLKEVVAATCGGRSTAALTLE